MTLDELRALASELNIPGRSKLTTKAALETAIADHERMVEHIESHAPIDVEKLARTDRCLAEALVGRPIVSMLLSRADNSTCGAGDAGGVADVCLPINATIEDEPPASVGHDTSPGAVLATEWGDPANPYYRAAVAATGQRGTVDSAYRQKRKRKNKQAAKARRNNRKHR